MESTKQCSDCGKYKTLDCFHINKFGEYNRDSRCKECKSKNNKKKQLENKKNIDTIKLQHKNIKKYCVTCNIEKNIDEFSLRLDSGKYRSECIDCQAATKRKIYLENRDDVLKKRSIYREKNKEVLNTKQKEFRKNNPGYAAAVTARYREKHPEKVIEQRNKYRKNNKDEISKSKKKYYIEVRSNPVKKLALTLRIRLRDAIKKGIKAGSAVRDLGCPLKDLKIYLEKQFYPNAETGEMMTWDNYGKFGWHIDHIKPLSSFNLENRDELLKACHYTNLQPLWAKENLQKGSKINWSKK